jgi:hypothetical protein
MQASSFAFQRLATSWWLDIKTSGAITADKAAMGAKTKARSSQAGSLKRALANKKKARVITVIQAMPKMANTW